MTISPRRTATGLIGWFVTTNILIALAHLTGWWGFQIILFVCIAFLPGAALLRLFCISLRTLSANIIYSLGLSILVLILSGLAVNQMLYMFGVAHPLEFWGIVGSWDIVTGGIIAGSIWANRKPLLIAARQTDKISRHTWLLGALTLLLPCLAAFGAFRLNNGGDASLAIFTLCFAAVLIVYAIVARNRLPDGLLAWLIFILGLTILLMTSLRGWDIVGHDIEREFRVYTLTHLHGHWDIGLDHDPYNACLSITILPEMFAKMLGISGLVVFKVILQVIFAACPVVLYILLRQYASKLGALIGSLLFICYPTFINDSAMLTRQGVAYLFFALALLVISNKTQKKRYKLLFLLCALGAVLSHYSTAYMFVALFACAVVCKLCLAWWLRRRGASKHAHRGTVLSPLFAALLFLMTFLWYTQITGTSGGLSTTINKSLANIPKLFSEDSKSSDTSAALVFAGGKTQGDLYQSYLTNSLSEVPSSAGNAAQYIPDLTSDDLPLTSLGEKARAIGLQPSLISVLRQNFAKFLQLLALAGVMYATYRLLRKKSNALGLDFICLSLAGIMLLALMVVLPILSLNYGILRAFQQALIFLILPITLLLVRLGQYTRRWINTSVATIGIVALFCLFTGLFAQLLGQASPSLSMNNRGLYFGLYYSPEADKRAFAWLGDHIPKGNDVRAANFNRALMHNPDYPFSRAGILPSQISNNSFVYLDAAQVQAQRLYSYYESSPLVMTFPLDYFAAKKSQIYSTLSTRVYR